jgi:hypothetical protein
MGRSEAGALRAGLRSAIRQIRTLAADLEAEAANYYDDGVPQPNAKTMEAHASTARRVAARLEPLTRTRRRAITSRRH